MERKIIRRVLRSSTVPVVIMGVCALVVGWIFYLLSINIFIGGIVGVLFGFVIIFIIGVFHLAPRFLSFSFEAWTWIVGCIGALVGFSLGVIGTTLAHLVGFSLPLGNSAFFLGCIGVLAIVGIIAGAIFDERGSV